jgi:predicted  nucleic acid-binding Zn-ribbon protein
MREIDARKAWQYNSIMSEEKNNQGEKEMTLDDLAAIVQNSLLELKSDLKSDIKGLKNDIKEVKSDTEHIKAEINKKVDKIIHNELEYRVEKVEEKLQLKPKLKFA